MKKIDLVFRTIGERTSKFALELAKKNIAPDNIYVIENVIPFSEAVRQMLTIDFQGDVVVFMDADCLIMENMRPFLEKNDMIYVDSYLLDKFRGHIHMGVHITRIDLVRAMQQIGFPDPKGELVLWPESGLRHAALQKFGGEHKAFKQFRILHDFGQCYHHIFMKYALRELRSRRSAYHRARFNWCMKGWWENDLDFVVAKHAVEYTRKVIAPEESEVEVAQFVADLPRTAQQALAQLGRSEKPPLTWQEVLDLNTLFEHNPLWRQNTCKVFGIGLGRTGTKSLTKALNILGFNVVHYPTEACIFEKLIRGECDFPLLEYLDGITDITVAPYYAQLDQRYPNSKFILTVRDKEAWLSSLERHWHHRFAFDATPGRELHIKIRQFLRAAVYGSYTFNRERMSYVYDLHYKNVTEYFKDRPEALLILDITKSEGWKKLCPFLNKPILDEPFPDIKKLTEL